METVGEKFGQWLQLISTSVTQSINLQGYKGNDVVSECLCVRVTVKLLPLCLVDMIKSARAFKQSNESLKILRGHSQCLPTVRLNTHSRFWRVRLLILTFEKRKTNQKGKSQNKKTVALTSGLNDGIKTLDCLWWGAR